MNTSLVEPCTLGHSMCPLRLLLKDSPLWAVLTESSLLLKNKKVLTERSFSSWPLLGLIKKCLYGSFLKTFALNFVVSALWYRNLKVAVPVHENVCQLGAGPHWRRRFGSHQAVPGPC
jgi:hypothetical protein